MIRGAFLILAGLVALFPAESRAACNVMINGRPMTPQECQTALQIYGEVIPGRYAVDEYGNWVNLDNPWHRGNTYADAQRLRGSGGSGGTGHWSDGGMTQTPFGSVGGGYYFDPETGNSVGPD